MFYSVITKILNWEILTKNLVTYKKQDEINGRKCQCYGGSLKNPIFSTGGGGGHKKNIIQGGIGGGVDTPMHTMLLGHCTGKNLGNDV